MHWNCTFAEECFQNFKPTVSVFRLYHFAKIQSNHRWIYWDFTDRYPKKWSLKIAVSDNRECTKTNISYHKFFSKFRAVNGGWLKRWCDKTYNFMHHFANKPKSNPKSRQRQWHKKVPNKSLPQNSLSQRLEYTSFEHLPFEASWYQYSTFLICGADVCSSWFQKLRAWSVSTSISMNKFRHFNQIKLLSDSGKTQNLSL